MKKLYEQTVNNGGITFRLNDDAPTSGYLVSIPAFSQVVEKDFTEQVLKEFVDRNKHLVETVPNLYFGVWLDTDTGFWHLDLSGLAPDKESGIRTGHVAHQLAIWDVRNNKEIRLPEWDEEKMTLEKRVQLTLNGI